MSTIAESHLSNKDLAPIPSLLMLAAVHHHLIRNETRMKCGLVVEAGDVREVLLLPTVQQVQHGQAALPLRVARG